MSTTNQQPQQVTHRRYIGDADGTVYWPYTAWDAVIGLDAHVNQLISASSGGSGSFSGITMDAILTVVQQHLSVALDVKTGHLQLTATDVTEQDVVSQIAAKVIASIKISVTNGDLTIEGSD
ncbi:hypothetical protein [Loigolactobacillus coryniformis]|uniref:hypothetical protein n=1 Tax=Loigolactobacillus coryniformis TaxID=1610 RepID=UPI000550EF3D|nr:hypothetical protein [Loigolactobacillus coryniformis]